MKSTRPRGQIQSGRHLEGPRATRKTIPLLRGVLFQLLRWHGDPDRPHLLRRDAQISVWCPWCADEHIHGWYLRHDGRHATHRSAHCFNIASPLLKTGYWISVFRKSDEGYKAHIVTPGVEILMPKPDGWDQRWGRTSPCKDLWHDPNARQAVPIVVPPIDVPLDVGQSTATQATEGAGG